MYIDEIIIKIINYNKDHVEQNYNNWSYLTFMFLKMQKYCRKFLQQIQHIILVLEIEWSFFFGGRFKQGSPYISVECTYECTGILMYKLRYPFKQLTLL